MTQIKDYPYLYETHLHTNQSSACAHNSGYEMAKAAHEAGYTGIIVTDHNWGGNNCIDSSLSWKDWVLEFSKGYLDAKSYGDSHDFDVFFGYEAGYNATEFLIYGADTDWLIAHPEIRTATIEQQFDLIHDAGGMVIHAHPFREEWYIPEIRLFPDYVDGVEGINATHSSRKSTSHNKTEFDDKAVQYAREHHLPMTAGSDIHSTYLFGGGMAFKRRLTSVQDFCSAVLSDEDYVLTNGDFVFDKYGSKK
ncbi:MAG: PHP domain-containing protein [Lachnospiraceae bacterium]|nr:PHP domain-containing protein [Lachnospiraceae bacterium]